MLHQELISKFSSSRTPIQKVDVSREAQLRDIEASFESASGDSFDLASLKHPNKPHLKAVDSYEILPDSDIWANAYDLFRFSERPGERHPDVSLGHCNIAFLLYDDV